MFFNPLFQSRFVLGVLCCPLSLDPGFVIIIVLRLGSFEGISLLFLNDLGDGS